jgi:hypothetical protein
LNPLAGPAPRRTDVQNVMAHGTYRASSNLEEGPIFLDLRSFYSSGDILASALYIKSN